MVRRSQKACHLRLTFFFPGVEYRAVYKREVFELTYHGGGGFSWSEVMDMPISERRLNIKFINEHLHKVQEMQQKNQMVTADKPLTSKPGIKRPDGVEPTYTSKIKTKR